MILLHALNICGVASSIVLVLVAVRVLSVARAREISLRALLAFAVGVSGAWPIGHVVGGGQLAASYVFLLVTSSAYIAYRIWNIRRQEPRRQTDFAELM